jgi:hypothetical protein
MKAPRKKYYIGDSVLYKYKNNSGACLNEINGKIGVVIGIEDSWEILHVKFDVCRFTDRDYYRLGFDDIILLDDDFSIDL